MEGVKLMFFNKDMKKYKRGDLYLVEANVAEKLKHTFWTIGKPNTVSFFNYDDLKPYKDGETCSMVIFIRSGAIGDILALSSPISRINARGIVCKYIVPDIYASVIEWVDANLVEHGSSFRAIMTGLTQAGLKNFFKMVRRGDTSSEVEDGGQRNWYKVYNEALGFKDTPDILCRPQLKKERIYSDPSRIDVSLPSILIVNRASSPNRCMAFKTIYEAIRLMKNTAPNNIYVHDVNLLNDDYLYIERTNNKLPESERIKVIRAYSSVEFLLDCYDASLLISVDTAALHFREGIERPALGIYAAFHPDARTKYYRFTKSIYLKSDCKHQPCFMHGFDCRMAMGKDRNSPCLEVSMNRKIVQKISNAALIYIAKAGLYNLFIKK